MRVEFKHTQLNDTSSKNLADKLLRRTVRPKYRNNRYRYNIDASNPNHASIIKTGLKNLLETQVHIRGITLYIKVPKTATLNLVPETWPGAMKPDPSNPSVQIAKPFTEYSLTYEGTTEAAIGIGYWPIFRGINNFGGKKSSCEPDEVKRAVDHLAASDYSLVIFGKDFDQWKIDNGIP